MVATIVEGSNTVSFLYGSDNQRIKQTDSRGDTFYYTGAGIKVEKLVNGAQTTWHEYLYAGGGIVGEHFTKTGTVTDTYTYFFVTDHLGSVAVITDELGTVTERLSYDAWGKRRESDGDDSPIQIVSATTLGFTGHEMIDDVGLINMNGRIYDPTIGRFMSADPFIQDVTNSQNLNRYTYVNNNPLSYTDPSGFFFKKLFKALFAPFKAVVKFVKKFWRPILAIALAVATKGLLTKLAIGLGAATSSTGALTSVALKAAIAGVSGGLSNIVATGRPKSFFTGFAQAAALTAVGGTIFKNAPGADASSASKVAYYSKKAIVHGVIGGAVSEARGGKFSSGFVAAGVSAFAGIKSFDSDTPATAYHAVVGGVGSVLGGGKFADGAVSGAFGYLFNECSTKDCFISREKVLYTVLNVAAAIKSGDPFGWVVDRLNFGVGGSIPGAPGFAGSFECSTSGCIGALGVGGGLSGKLDVVGSSFGYHYESRGYRGGLGATSTFQFLNSPVGISISTNVTPSGIMFEISPVSPVAGASGVVGFVFDTRPYGRDYQSNQTSE